MTIYSAQQGDIIAPGVTNSITEFVNGFVGACGEAAAAILEGAKNAVTPSSGDITTLVNALVSRGIAARNGTTSSQALASQLNIQGVGVSVIDNWRQAIAQVTSRPVELLLHNAQALPGDQGVLGHFISVVGFQPSTNKFVVSDPNSQAAKQGKFVLFSASQLAAADPINAIVPNNPTGSGPGGIIIPNPIQQVGQSIGIVTGAVGSVAGATVGQATGQVVSGVGSVTADTLSQAASLIGTTFDHSVKAALGVNSAKDLGIRFALIIAAFMLFGIGLLALILGQANNNKQEIVDAGETAAVAA